MLIRRHTYEFIKPWVPYGWQRLARAAMRKVNMLLAARQQGKTELAEVVCLETLIFSDYEDPKALVVSTTKEACVKNHFHRFLGFLRTNPNVIIKDKTTGVIQVERPWKGDVLTIQFYGFENAETIRGETADFVYVDEVQDAPYGLYASVIKPALVKRKGRTIITGTVKKFSDSHREAEWMKKMAENDPDEYSYQEFNIWKCDAWTHEEKLKEKEFYQGSEELREKWEEEYELNFEIARRNAIYADLVSKAVKESRVTNITPIASLPVHTGWDLGATNHVWAYQIYQSKIHLLEYYTSKEKSDEHYIKYLLKKYPKHGRWILPWDAKHEVQGQGFTRYEKFKELTEGTGISIKVRPKIGKKEHRIQTVRELFSRMKFDEEGCRDGLMHLAQYSRVVDKKTGYVTKNIKSGKHCHASDALGEICMYTRYRHNEELDGLEKTWYNKKRRRSGIIRSKKPKKWF